MKKQYHHNLITNKGFSLSEVILAAAILAFALTSLLTLFIAFMLLNESSRNLSVATGHAQYVLEEIKNSEFDNVEDDINAGNWGWNEEEIGGNGLTALRDESIDTVVNGQASDPLDVSVIVNWKDRMGQDRQIELETLFTENGVIS